jgi:hypothetical protein
MRVGDVAGNICAAPATGPCPGPRPAVHYVIFVWAEVQGLTLVHYLAQLEPCLTDKNTLHTLNTPLTRATQPLRAPPIP